MHSLSSYLALFGGWIYTDVYEALHGQTSQRIRTALIISPQVVPIRLTFWAVGAIIALKVCFADYVGRCVRVGREGSQI